MKSNLSEHIKSYHNIKKRYTRPYIIAEAGVNHECSMDIARQIIDEAKFGGADAIKFQTYKAETIASINSPAYWDTNLEQTKNQFNLFKKYDKFWKKEFELLKTYCDKLNIEFLSTPFDFESAKFLNDLMDVFKISSSDLNNKPFIEYIASFGKPIILSTGASHIEEVKKAVSWFHDKVPSYALLHCILNYPTLDNNAELGMIEDLQAKFPNVMVGYSDHTLPGEMHNLEVASLLGAKILEKHFTHNKSLKGNDHYHSMDKNDLVNFNKRLDRLSSLYGSGLKEPIGAEIISRQNARRSIVSICNLEKGHILSKSDLTFKRPGTGIPPDDIEKVVGKKLKFSIEEDDIINWEMFLE